MQFVLGVGCGVALCMALGFFASRKIEKQTKAKEGESLGEKIEEVKAE